MLKNQQHIGKMAISDASYNYYFQCNALGSIVKSNSIFKAPNCKTCMESVKASESLPDDFSMDDHFVHLRVCFGIVFSAFFMVLVEDGSNFDLHNNGYRCYNIM